MLHAASCAGCGLQRCCMCTACRPLIPESFPSPKSAAFERLCDRQALVLSERLQHVGTAFDRARAMRYQQKQQQQEELQRRQQSLRLGPVRTFLLCCRLSSLSCCLMHCTCVEVAHTSICKINLAQRSSLCQRHCCMLAMLHRCGDHAQAQHLSSCLVFVSHCHHKDVRHAVVTAKIQQLHSCYCCTP